MRVKSEKYDVGRKALRVGEGVAAEELVVDEHNAGATGDLPPPLRRLLRHRRRRPEHIETGS